jgi:hypothetical protein
MGGRKREGEIVKSEGGGEREYVWVEKERDTDRQTDTHIYTHIQIDIPSTMPQLQSAPTRRDWCFQMRLCVCERESE